MTQFKQILEKVRSLENLLVSFATGGGGELQDYLSLRNELLNESLVAEKMPDFIRTCRDLSQFWAFIKKQSATYQGRREFLWAQFGLGALRNKLGDAHGGGQSRVKPSKRHAELAVNLAGTMASFLVATWEEQQKKKS